MLFVTATQLLCIDNSSLPHLLTQLNGCGAVLDMSRLPLQVREGVEPNEHGTWQYGRDGWCDGQNVKPWVVEITRNLYPAGGLQNVVQYTGLYQGKTPDPEQQPGYIMMQSNVVFYTDMGEGTRGATDGALLQQE